MDKLHVNAPYRRRESLEDCIITSITGDVVEYVSAKVVGGVFAATCSKNAFRKEFELTPFYVDTLLGMLQRRGERCGISRHAKKLLTSIPRVQIPEGEPFMATKKSAAKPESTPTPKKSATKPEAKAKSTAKPEAKSTKKATPAAAPEKSGPGRKSAFSDGMKITVLAKENPKRAKAAERFALYKNGMTIGDYVAAGGTMADVRWDVKQNFISVK